MRTEFPVRSLTLVRPPPQGSIISSTSGSINTNISKPFSTAVEDVEDVVSSVQGYYDDPNALNFHMQVYVRIDYTRVCTHARGRVKR